VELLLNHKDINVNVQELEGWSALHISCRYSNTDSTTKTVEMLLKDENIDVNLKDHDGIIHLLIIKVGLV
jgi:ankyrin repeat protein